ncbi:MAG: hypothetical protein LUH23_02045 [Oscillospiraceae bacterium]|nr:hypothetical protein [Oscillospiraceae bacterium]
MIIETVCRHIKNYFISEVHAGEFTISGGAVTDADFMRDGYYLIWGSKYNDAVHLYPDDVLTDEEFSGDIALMNPPEDFLALCEEIETYMASDMASPSPYKKESFGGYSYELEDTEANNWQKVFASRLNQWRKI